MTQSCGQADLMARMTRGMTLGVRVVATDEDESRPVAMGAGAFTLDRPQGLSAEGMVI